ncbi:MAG TPA: ABC transporter permease, partial [Ilumatobacteraceae bacterium]
HDHSGNDMNDQATARPSRRTSVLEFLKQTGGIYLLVLMIILFGFLEPDTFLTQRAFKTILNQYAVGGLLALSLIVPLAAGVYDLSVGAQASLASVTVAVLISNHHMAFPLAILVTLLVGLAVGLFNALVVVVLRIDSFIGTLGTSAILGALAVGVSGNRTITSAGVSGAFQKDVALKNIDGITMPVLYLLIAMIVIGYLLEQTKTGRQWYSIGFDADAALLAGVRTQSLRVSALLVSAVTASIGGITLTARVASGTPGAGDPYLLTAFAGAFLGATQFRRGRFNSWGTVFAVMLIGTGGYGISLTGAPQWAPKVFDGFVLIAAVGIANIGGMRKSLPKWLRKGATPAATEAAPTS